MILGFGMFCYVMVLIIGVTASQGCPEYNCTQEKLFNGDDVFKCAIRTKSGWEDFQKKNNVSEHYSTHDHVSITPPILLTAINWYTTPEKIQGTVMFNPSLNVTFRVPFEKNTEFYAVLLKFESPDVPGWKDEIFVDNPRYRLFDFHQYSPSSVISSNKIYHRDISYPCIQYLDESDSMRVYQITLTGFIKEGATPGVSLTHLVTAYNPLIRKLNPALDLKEWKSTIVMAVIPGTYNIYVLFERAPLRVLYYRVKLLKIFNSTDEIKVKKSVQVYHPINNHIFKHNVPGIYKVKITPYSQKCSGLCSSSESYYVTVNKLTGTDLWYPYKVLVLASVVVMLVVTSIVFCVWRLRESREIFLLDFCEDPERPKVIHPLAQYLKENTKYRIITTRSLPKDHSDRNMYLLRFCKKLKFNNSENRLIMIELCNCHIAETVRQLENKRNEQRIKVLSDDIILLSLGSIRNFSNFDLLNSYTVLDLTKDQNKLWGFIFKNESFSNFNYSPRYNKFMESIGTAHSSV